MSSLRFAPLCRIAAALLVVACAPTPPAAIDRPVLAAGGADESVAAEAALRGVVTDAGGAAVEGATVIAFTGDSEEEPVFFAKTSRDGTFRFDRLPPGAWRVSASSVAGLALGGEPIALRGPDDHAEKRLQLEPATHVLSGSVGDELDAPLRGVTVTVNEVSERPGSRFGVVADARGAWHIGISTNAPYVVAATAPGRGQYYQRVSPGAESATPITLAPPAADRPDDATLTAWLAAEAKPLAGATPRSGLDDLDPIGKMIGGARIIALGEATHASSELFRLKHRLLEHLVEREGVTVFAMEAGIMEALALDAYVMRGEGRADAALHGLHTWVWETEEMLDVVEWIRAWNAKHAEKVRFEGFDITAWSAVRALTAYLEKVDPGVGANFKEAIHPLDQPSSDASYPNLSDAVKQSTRAAIEHVQVRLEERKRAYVERAGAPAWELAMRQLAVARQAEAVFRDPLSRDAAMAANVDAMVARHPAGTRVALWMHNAHASAEPGRLMDMGRVLRETHGDQYFVLGFAFGRGGFRAWVPGDSAFAVKEHVVGDPIPESFEAALGLAQLPLYAVDLRTAGDDVRAWLASPIPAWSIGGAFIDEKNARMRIRPAEAFDAVIYVDRLTASHPLPEKKK